MAALGRGQDTTLPALGDSPSHAPYSLPRDRVRPLGRPPALPPPLDRGHRPSAHWPFCGLSSTESPVRACSLSARPCPGSRPPPAAERNSRPIPQAVPTPGSHTPPPTKPARPRQRHRGTASPPPSSPGASPPGTVRLGPPLSLSPENGARWRGRGDIGTLRVRVGMHKVQPLQKTVRQFLQTMSNRGTWVPYICECDPRVGIHVQR